MIFFLFLHKSNIILCCGTHKKCLANEYLQHNVFTESERNLYTLLSGAMRHAYFGCAMPKCVLGHMRTAKAQTSLCIHTVWSGPSLTIIGQASVAQLDWLWSGGCRFNPSRVGNILSRRLIMKYFLRSFSPFHWFKKGSCQFQKEIMCTILANHLKD